MICKDNGVKRPNKTAAPTAAMALLFDVGHHWRGIGEPSR
jgi:hypothetical protein